MISKWCNVILSDIANPIDYVKNEVKPCRVYETQTLENVAGKAYLSCLLESIGKKLLAHECQ